MAFNALKNLFSKNKKITNRKRRPHYRRKANAKGEGRHIWRRPYAVAFARPLRVGVGYRWYALWRCNDSSLYSHCD
jgi:hypothetical protein